MPRSSTSPVSLTCIVAAQRQVSTLLTPKSSRFLSGLGGAAALRGGGPAPARHAPAPCAPAARHAHISR